MENHRAFGGDEGLSALWRLIETGGAPFSELANHLRHRFTGQGITQAERDRIDAANSAPARNARPVNRQYLDAVRGDLLPYPAAQGFRVVVDDDDEEDARQLGEIAVRVPQHVLEIPHAWDRAQAIEPFRFNQLEQPKRHEWDASAPPAMPSGLERLLRGQ